MAKITPRGKNERETIVVKTNTAVSNLSQALKWWKADNKADRAIQAVATVGFLKEQQLYRERQATRYSRLYGNLPLHGWVGSNLSKMGAENSLPSDRPTMNVIQSCVDTLVSRITQSRPRPVFLTNMGDYKQRKVAKDLNFFIQGELYQTKAYQIGELILRDAAAVFGTGCVKVYESDDNKVAIERVLATELYVDPSDARFGNPRQLFQLKLVDREVLHELFPDRAAVISTAEQAFPDNGSESSKTISDQVMVVESWRLPSAKDAGDGMHLISCTNGWLLDEKFEKNRFPFAFLNYSSRIVGMWGQSLSEQLMGTQMEINKLLMTISQSINLVGVPRIFVEDGSKVVKAHLNNQIGAIITYRGTKPLYEVAPCVPGEVYQQLQRLIEGAYQQSGISALAAAAQKPAGLDSGAALREYDDLQSDRFASLVRRYDNFYIDLSDLITDKARDIAERDGEYQTIYPSKNAAQEVNLPDTKLLKENPFVLQVFDASALPRDPSGRMAKITEMIQSGMVSISEGRRLLDFPDLDQVNVLAAASEERIFKILDKIVEDGDYTPPDPFLDLQLANQLTTQYYNLYVAANIEEEKAQMIRTFSTQVKALISAAIAPPPQPATPMPVAQPEPQPTSPLVPNVPSQLAAA